MARTCGLRKRAGFARALVMDPSIVFFDEPDSGLNPVRTSSLNDLILDMHAEQKGTYGEAEGAFANEDPFVRQFLAGESAGPLSTD